MKAIRRFNNNIVLCITNKGKEVVAFGKGIGFHEIPYEVDLSKIERTYYSVDEQYLGMIKDITDGVFKISSDIVDIAKEKLNCPFTGNIVFTLADHITFAIKKYKENMNIKLPILYDIHHLFETEYEIGKHAIKLIKEQLKIDLPKEEACYIALHLINAKEQNNTKQIIDNDDIINEVTRIIEQEYKIIVNKDNFNYSRFVSHMHYLMKRTQTKHLINSDNTVIYEKLKEDCPETYECTKKVNNYFYKKLWITLNDEEELYLMLHINRLCTREECNR